MQPENAIIPYHATDPTGNRALVFAPHPDDEILGCGGCLALHVAAGDAVKIVFMTNGAAGDIQKQCDRADYIQTRQAEAIRACRQIGIRDYEFWDFEDRQLFDSPGALALVLDEIAAFAPELIYAPSALEFHPDHRAAHFLVSSAVSSCQNRFDVAFYEVNQPLAPNSLVDITPVASKKFSALEAYQSQLKERDYRDIAEGLSRFRRLTLPDGTFFAEAFYRVNAEALRESSFICIYQQEVKSRIPGLETIGPLVSVIIRTKDRPALLANALASVAGQTYRNIEVVLVNDGGEDVGSLADRLLPDMPVRYADLPTGRGRAAAANAGLEAARGKYVNFLDDDDILYPEHLATLVAFCYVTDKKIVYSGVKNIYFDGYSGNQASTPGYEEIVYNCNFNPDALLFFKYIPIMSVLFDRRVLSDVPGFNEALPVFEDWDFWIRLSRCHTFNHMDRITAEYRFYSSDAREVYWKTDKTTTRYRDRVFKYALPHIGERAWGEYLNFIIANGRTFAGKGADSSRRLNKLLKLFKKQAKLYCSRSHPANKGAEGFKRVRLVKRFLKLKQGIKLLLD